MAAQEFELSGTWGTIAHARVPAPDRGGYARCEKHGQMERVDPDAVGPIEKNGVVWEFDGRAPTAEGDGVMLHYCEECVERELRTHDRQEARYLDLLREEIAEEWTNKLRRGQMERSLFSVESVDTAAADPLYCPYCADMVEAAGDGGLECSVHGRLAIDVEALEDAEVPSP